MLSAGAVAAEVVPPLPTAGPIVIAEVPGVGVTHRITVIEGGRLPVGVSPSPLVPLPGVVHTTIISCPIFAFPIPRTVSVSGQVDDQRV